MKNINIYKTCACAALALMPVLTSCEREIDTDVLATSPKIGDVFIDGFSAGLTYQAWGKVTNLSVDNDVKHSGGASICIDVPVHDDPEGNFAGGNFICETGRDLSDFNCLTFWAKASTTATIEVGFGNYGDGDYIVSMHDAKVRNSWTKFIIPIPNAAKLTAEKSLFYYAAGEANGAGYNIWIDDIKFEKNPLLAHPRIKDLTTAGFLAGDMEIGQLECSVNLPTGKNQPITVSSKYFDFVSSNPEVATVEGNKIVFQGAKGQAVITTEQAEGEIRITDIYDFAPEPTLPAEDVISVFCDKYTNHGGPVFNNYWEPYQTTVDDRINAGGNLIHHYGKFNFVGIVFYDGDIDVSEMTHLHMDVLLMDKNPITVTNFTVTPHTETGIEGEAGHARLKSGEWVSIDVPLSFDCTPVHEFVLARDEGCYYDDILVDNIYFYKK